MWAYGFLFNQLMESELFISKPPALRHLRLPQHHIHRGRVCTKYYNGLAIRATFIASKQVWGIILGCGYSC